MTLPKSLVALSLLTAASTAFAITTDINGLQLGMRAPQAKAALKQMNPQFATADLLKDDKAVGLNATALAPSGPIRPAVDFAAVLFDDAGAAWYIGRGQKFEGSARPSTKTLREALVAKYGEPSYSTMSSMEWSYPRGATSAVKLQAGKAGPCTFTQYDTLTSPTIGPSLIVPKEFSPKCGVHITAQWVHDAGSEMIGQLQVAVYDGARIYDQISNTKKSSAEAAARKRASELENAAKPKL